MRNVVRVIKYKKKNVDGQNLSLRVTVDNTKNVVLAAIDTRQCEPTKFEWITK